MSSSENLFKNFQEVTPPKEPAPTHFAANKLVNGSESGSTSDVQEVEAPTMTELDMLKARARLMGITFSNNISVDTLRTKIQAKLDGEAQEPEAPEAEEPAEDPVPAAATAELTTELPPPGRPLTAAEKKQKLREDLLRDEMALVRLRITNLDPKKAALPGEIFTVANEYIGTVRKYIPYGELTDNGYHVPRCIYNQLLDRTFVSIKTRKGPRGQPVVETQDVREFALEVLPPLTPKELATLAAAQAAQSAE